MAVALKNNCDNLERNQSHIFSLEENLIAQLNNSGLDYLQNGGLIHLPGLVSLSFKGQDGEAILHRLDLMGISISTGAACDSVNTQVSHVIEAINVPKEYSSGTIRISIGKNNTEEDIDRIVGAINKVILK